MPAIPYSTAELDSAQAALLDLGVFTLGTDRAGAHPEARRRIAWFRCG